MDWGISGIANHSVGNSTTAIEYWQQSLVIAREMKNREGESAALGNLGIAGQISGQ